MNLYVEKTAMCEEKDLPIRQDDLVQHVDLRRHPALVHLSGQPRPHRLLPVVVAHHAVRVDVPADWVVEKSLDEFS